MASNKWRFDFGDGFLSADFVLDNNKVTVIPDGGFPGMFSWPASHLLGSACSHPSCARVWFAEGSYTLELPVVSFGSAGGKSSAASIQTPMPGRVVKVVSTPGSTVEAGATLMIVEAMKMEVCSLLPTPSCLTSGHVVL